MARDTVRMASKSTSTPANPLLNIFTASLVGRKWLLWYELLASQSIANNGSVERPV
jgi:hypothetical protein